MTSLQKANEQWAVLKMQRAATAYKAAMQPHNAAFDEPPAQQAALLVITVSMAFAAGKTSRNDVTNTLRLASEMSGIPVDAWAAMSDLQICLAQLQHAKCSVITGGKK